MNIYSIHIDHSTPSIEVLTSLTQTVSKNNMELSILSRLIHGLSVQNNSPASFEFINCKLKESIQYPLKSNFFNFFVSINSNLTIETEKFSLYQNPSHLIRHRNN